MPPSITQTATLFAFMALGFLCSRLGILNPERDRGISALLVKVTLPALIFSAMVRPYESELLPRVLLLIGVAFAVYAACIGISVLASKAMGGPERRRGVYRYGMIFSNAGFMGFPVLEALFGGNSVFYASVYNVAFQILAFSVGLVILGWESKKRGSGAFKDALNPNTVSALLGLAFFLFRIPLPKAVHDSIARVGDMTTPLSMMFIGSLLSRSSPLALLKDWRMWVSTAFRVAAAPLLVFISLKAVIRDPAFPIEVPVMIAAMPVAANTAILAEEAGGDAEAASMLVTMSTFASLLTIPLISRLLFGV
jgi:malate permease and related proteins